MTDNRSESAQMALTITKLLKATLTDICHQAGLEPRQIEMDIRLAEQHAQITILFQDRRDPFSPPRVLHCRLMAEGYFNDDIRILTISPIANNTLGRSLVLEVDLELTVSELVLHPSEYVQ